MKTKQLKEKVAVVKHDGTYGSFVKALELCAGLDGLKITDKILVKPNIVWGGTRNFPQYGRVTTSTMVEYVLRALRDRGCTDITIGEGTVTNKEMGSTTTRGFEWSGIGKVAQRYGARLVDFNSEPYVDVELQNTEVKISRWALESDFLIDLPVLKTHRQTKISLGMKNLKGCLAPGSKKAFHKHGLNRMIALLNIKVKPSFTIIDGIYGLERGPEMLGTPHRMDIIIAGKDVFSCDIVGAMVMGINPEEVEFLREFASITGRSVSLDGVEVTGEPIESVTRPLEWRLSFEDIFHQAGIDGLTVQEPSLSCCSGCVVILSGLIGVFTKDSPGIAMDRVEVCLGEVRAKEESKRVFLLGDCAVFANKDLKDAVKVKGCPPPVMDTVKGVVLKCLPPGRAARVLMSRTVKKIGTQLGVYSESFPVFGTCEPPAFDRKHF